MLKTRIITAIVLLAVLLSALFASNPIYWQLLMVVVAVVGLWEWLNLCHIDNKVTHLIAYFVLIGLLFVFYFNLLSTPAIVLVSLLLWAGLISVTLLNQPAVMMLVPIKLAIGLWLLSVSVWFLIQLQQLNSHRWILLFMLSIWSADIGAYFVGRRFGKHKLAPTVSPGKTIEGLLGGLLLVTLVALPLLLTRFVDQKLVILLPTVLIVALISVMGDLYESKLKRIAGVKDSSQVLPGHGGILDRVDSILAGLPFFMAGLLLLGVI